MTDEITRRGVIAATTAASLSGACTPTKKAPALSAQTEPRTGVFKLGIASGDPRTNSLVIWTHITPADPRQANVNINWALSRNADMSEPVITGQDSAKRANDWTFKAIPSGLESGQTYYYQFTAEGTKSPIGRTRTLPEGAVDKLRFAVVSCANWQQGFFNVYDHIARSGDFDAMIHLGDYLYEYGTDKDSPCAIPL